MFLETLENRRMFSGDTASTAGLPVDGGTKPIVLMQSSTSANVMNADKLLSKDGSSAQQGTQS